jgi:hypothetical protein
MHPSARLSLLCALLMSSSVDRLAAAEDTDKNAWTVVGADRMDVAVLEGDAPLLTLTNTLIGPDWKHSRLDRLAEVDGPARVYRQQQVGFFAHWADKQPMEGRFDLRYELTQVDAKTFRARYTCTPEFDTAFGIPKGQGRKSIAIGPVLGPTPYFDGGTCLLTYAAGTTEELPWPPPRGSKPQVASATLRTADGKTTKLVFDPPVVLQLPQVEIHVITAPTLRLDRELHRAQLREVAQRLRPRLLLLDPLVRLHGIDENNASEVAELLGYLRALQRQLDLSVILVHHTRKNAPAGVASGQALRGSSDLHAFGDSNLYLRRTQERLLLSSEHRAAPASPPVYLQLVATNAETTHLEVVAIPEGQRPRTPRTSLGASARRRDAHANQAPRRLGRQK